MTSISSTSTSVYIPPLPVVSLPANTNTGTMMTDGAPLAGSGAEAGSAIGAVSATTVNTYA